jgi:hypothetical protein
MKKKNSNILSVNVMIFVKAKANRSHQSFRFNSSHLIPKAKIRKRKYHPFKKTPPSTTITSIYMIKQRKL